jgi:ABC-2 type transport system permease protein
MTGLGLIRKPLRDYRVALISVSLVTFLVAFFMVLLFPAYSESLADIELPPALEGFIGEAEGLGTPEGFLHGEFFSWVPLIIITLAIIAGSGALAGEESSGTMDILLAQPIRRWRLVVVRALGLAFALSIPVLLAWPGFLLAKLFVDLGIGPWPLLLATLNILPLTFFFLALALLGSAAFPNRAMAAGIATAVVVATWFLNTFGTAVPLLEGWRQITPFYWMSAAYVFVEGFSILRFILLMLFPVVMVALAAFLFERRDVSLGSRDLNLLSFLRRRGEPEDEEEKEPPRTPGQPEPTAGG